MKNNNQDVPKHLIIENPVTGKKLIFFHKFKNEKNDIRKFILLIGYPEETWDEILVYERQIIDSIKIILRSQLSNEKDKILFDVSIDLLLRKSCYFDTELNFNDTINNLLTACDQILNVFIGD